MHVVTNNEFNLSGCDSLKVITDMVKLAIDNGIYDGLWCALWKWVWYFEADFLG